MNDSVSKIKEAICELDIDSIQGLVDDALKSGIDPWAIIGDGMGQGMKIVGERFEAGEYFLADLILAGEAMKEGMKPLEGLMEKGARSKKGTIILATVKGDIHDIGKNIVGTLLSAADFTVVDLGVDVPEDKIVAAVREHSAQGLGLSVLLTTMIGGLKDTVDALTEAGLRNKVKIAIGGACTSQKLADEMGVDAYGQDAVRAVGLFEQLVTTN